eukprot:437103-Pyramimonas_sp.AAC.1
MSPARGATTTPHDHSMSVSHIPRKPDATMSQATPGSQMSWYPPVESTGDVSLEIYSEPTLSASEE